MARPAFSDDVYDLRDPDSRRRYQNREAQSRYRDRTKGRVSVQKRVSVNLRLPDALTTRVTRTLHHGLATGSHTFKTPNELYEALLLIGFEHLDHPLATESAEQMKTLLHQNQIQSQRREAEAVKAQAEQELSALLAIGERQEAANFYHATMSSVSQWAETVWQRWLVGELKRLFPMLEAMAVTPTAMRAGKGYTPHVGGKRKTVKAKATGARPLQHPARQSRKATRRAR